MKRELAILSAILILMGCGGKKNNPPPDVTPTKALLTSPAQNEVCTTGTIISASQSNITFTWDASINTESYLISVKNLLTTGVTTQATTATQLTLSLLRNTPYSWSITSKSTKTSVTAQSDTWKFYNAGPGIVTYAPFPAEITSPTFGQVVTASGGTISLKWKGGSVTPGTISNYDVYFGTAKSPVIFKNAITDSFLNNVSAASGKIYYWKVITRDLAGNTSDSGIYQFAVN